MSVVDCDPCPRCGRALDPIRNSHSKLPGSDGNRSIVICDPCGQEEAVQLFWYAQLFREQARAGMRLTVCWES
jgi:hypothetical protein